MKEYDVIVLDSLYFELQEIVYYKIEKSQTISGAIKFRDAVFETIKNLTIFPQMGKGLVHGSLAKIVMGHLLVYRIDEVKQCVYVTDLIDPQQQSKAGKYY